MLIHNEKRHRWTHKSHSMWRSYDPWQNGYLKANGVATHLARKYNDTHRHIFVTSCKKLIILQITELFTLAG